MSGRTQANLSSYYVVSVADKGEALQLQDRLCRRTIVETCYMGSTTPPPPTTPSFVSLQHYRDDPPTGIGADAVTSVPGALGGATRVTDIEYGWTLTHEDLQAAGGPGMLVANGTPASPFGYDHGTAVLGELVGADNGIGVKGLVPQASMTVVNSYNTERGYDLATSILLAVQHMSAGDVLLIEQQWTGIGGFVPVEWAQAFYDAIVTATSLGIIVVEAAGNGGQNLDDPAYGAPFPGGRPDSGAIIVGAGSGSLARLSFSTFGSRVNLQGPGGGVATAGYGDLYQTNETDAYTSSFNGTSSASPVVAAAAASLSSAYETTFGEPPSPSYVRSRLIATGSAESSQSSGHIGPLPDLPEALSGMPREVAPPHVTAPTYAFAQVGVVSSTKTIPIQVTWSANDPDGIASTDLQLKTDGGSWKAVSLPSPTSTTLAKELQFGHTYLFRVRATDGLGNTSSWTAAGFDLGNTQEGEGVTYSGQWKNVSGSKYMAGAAKSTVVRNASASLAFSARAVAWIGTKGKAFGSSLVTVDDGSALTRSQQASATSYRNVIFRYSWAATGAHRIVISCQATAGHKECDLDALAFII